MGSAHLTSNGMLCDNTFLCPRTLFSSPISSWLSSPQPREATKLSLLQPPGVHKKPGLGQNHQSRLCCHLNSTSPWPASTSTSAAASECSIPRLREAVPVVTLLVSTKRTVDFHSQVKSPLKTCSQMHHWLSLKSPINISRTFLQVHCWLSPICHLTADFSHSGMLAHCWLGFARGAVSARILPTVLQDCVALYTFLRHCGAVILLLWAWYCLLRPHILHAGRPLWAWFCSWRSTCSDTAHSPPGLGHTLRFPIFLWRKFLLNCASPCYQVPPIKINCVLFHLTVLTPLASGWGISPQPYSKRRILHLWWVLHRSLSSYSSMDTQLTVQCINNCTI